MEVNDVIIAKVIAVGLGNQSFLQEIDKESRIPIIINERLKLREIYSVRVTRITPNFIMCKLAK